jgi:hypothetical protein
LQGIAFTLVPVLVAISKQLRRRLTLAKKAHGILAPAAIGSWAIRYLTKGLIVGDFVRVRENFDSWIVWREHTNRFRLSHWAISR